MSARTFGVARKGLALKRSSSKFSFKLNRAAIVRFVIQRKMVTKVAKKKKTMWLNMGAITSKHAKKGTNL